MVYEDICNFGMDQLVITQYKKILKIHLFSNGSVTLRFVYCCKDRCILLFFRNYKKGERNYYRRKYENALSN